MDYLRVKNFEKFQHYKDRSPPWIKLYNELLEDYEFGRLQDASKWHLIAIWLLASRSDNKIPNDPEWVARRINATSAVDLDTLVDSGLLEKIPQENQPLRKRERNASKPLAERKQSARPEREGEGEAERETEGEQRAPDGALSGSPPDAPRRLSKREEAAEVLAFLNLKAGKNFQATDTNLDFILARFKEGYTASDCRKVIVRKCRVWLNDDDMRDYLRPSTLFNREKFNQYAGELVAAEEPPPGGFLSEAEAEYGAAH